MKDAGLLKDMVMVFGQMNEPPGARFRVGHAALTMAEYFRDEEHRDVLLHLLQGSKIVNGVAKHIEHAPQNFFTNGNGKFCSVCKRNSGAHVRCVWQHH